MKGLVDLPQPSDRERAYERMLHGEPTPPDAAALALYTQWSRFDARLGEIWVDYVSDHWQEIHPIQLGGELMNQPWPRAAGVLLEFVALKLGRREANREAKRIRPWIAAVMGETVAAQAADVGGDHGSFGGEQFFIAQRRIGSKAMFDDARFSLKQYSKWGYLGRERLCRGSLGSYTPRVRQEILKSLLESLSGSQSRLNIQHYWEAVGRSISRRQAERDLAQSKRVRPVGRTKARTYVLRSGSKTQSS